MKPFMDKNFLLSNETAQKLYFDYAATTPVLDYHCHINPQEIYEDRQFENITQVWLGGAHYKWRFMRSCGVDEYFFFVVVFVFVFFFFCVVCFCVPAVWMSITSPEKLQTKRNSSNGLNA